MLCFCGSGLLNHLSQAWSVQQCGTCIAWTWKWFNSGGIQLHFSLSSVREKATVTADLMGVLPLREHKSCISVSVTELTFSHESGRRFSKIKKEKLQARLSDLTPSMGVCLYCMRWLGYASIQYLCMCRKVCLCVCAYICNLEWPFGL